MSDKPIYEAGFGSDALATPHRVVFVTRKTSAAVRGPAQRQLMAYPHLLLREAIVLQVLTIVLVVIGLFCIFEAVRGWCFLRACGIRTKL